MDVTGTKTCTATAVYFSCGHNISVVSVPSSAQKSLGLSWPGITCRLRKAQRYQYLYFDTIWCVLRVLRLQRQPVDIWHMTNALLGECVWTSAVPLSGIGACQTNGLHSSLHFSPGLCSMTQLSPAQPKNSSPRLLLASVKHIAACNII